MVHLTDTATCSRGTARLFRRASSLFGHDGILHCGKPAIKSSFNFQIFKGATYLMEAHIFPKPMWKPDGEIGYAPNRQGVEKMKKEGWGETCVKTKFPMALHGGVRVIPDGADSRGIPRFNHIPQSLTVNNEDEFQRALRNGWQLKPQMLEMPTEAPPSADRAPIGIEMDEEQEQEQEPHRRGPGRPPKVTA